MKKIVFLMLLVLLSTGLFACKNNTDMSDYTLGNVSYNGELENINIDWSAGSIRIKFSDDDAVALSETANKNLFEDTQMRSYFNGKSLDVVFCQTGNTYVSVGLKKELILTLPSNIDLQNLTIKTASANVYIDTLDCENIDIETSSGDVNASFAKAETIGLKTASGKIDAEIVFCDEIDIQSASGNSYITADNARYVNAESSSGGIKAEILHTPKFIKCKASSGNIDVCIPANSSFEATVDTSSGEFTSNFATVRNKNKYVCKDGGAEFTFETSSGNVHLYSK